MAQVRKTPATAPAPAGVSDIREARRRGPTAPRSEPVSEQPAADGGQEHAARLEALKQQIARGDYHPDPEEIARKILEHGF